MSNKSSVTNESKLESSHPEKLEGESLSIRQASIRNGLILALFALVSTGLIAIIHLITKDKIAFEVEAAMARRLNQVISSDQYENNAYKDCIELSADEQPSNNLSKIYRMRNKESDYALFITSAAPDGYAGKINLVIGVYLDGTIAGVRVTEHKETPGLGDKIEIEKSNWITQFDGRSLTNTEETDWSVKKDGGQFDALTGATITPRAIIKAVYNTLLYHHKHQAKLFSTQSNCGVAQ